MRWLSAFASEEGMTVNRSFAKVRAFSARAAKRSARTPQARSCQPDRQSCSQQRSHIGHRGQSNESVRRRIRRLLTPSEPLPDRKPDLSVLGLSHPPAPVLPLELFGSRWSQWIRDAAAAAACPPDYVVAPLLAAASALIGNARWPQAWPGWQEPPHLWCASVGDSGQGKSPGADPILRHVVPAIEARMARDFDFRIQVKLALIKAAEEGRSCYDDLRDPLIEPRFVESDLTIEKVAAVLSSAAPKGLLMVRDELAGWFLGMNRFHAGARAFWLEAYGGRPYSIDRVKSPNQICVPRLAVAWHGGIQPARLAKVMEAADDGLLARFIWFWPLPIKFERPKIIPNIDFAVSAFERLSILDMAAAPSGRVAAPITVPLTEKAAAQLESFAQKIQLEQTKSHGLLNSALGKARGLVLRLSLVIEYLRWAAEEGIMQAPAEIGEDALLAAIRLARQYLIPVAERVYGKTVQPPAARNVQTLARWIVTTHAREVHVRHIQRKIFLPGLTKAAEIHGACRVLIEAGWLLPPTCGTQEGRARQAYRVRPLVSRVLVNRNRAES